MLHRIENTTSDDWQVVRQNSLSLDALVGRLDDRAGRVGLQPSQLLEPQQVASAPGLLLTCDDGFASVERLVPLLEERELHLLLFVTVGFLDGTVQPYELQLAQLLSQGSKVHYQGETLSLEGMPARERTYQVLREPLKNQTHTERTAALESISQQNEWLLKPVSTGTYLGWQELRELAAHPRIHVGAHGLTHVPLAALGWRSQWQELKHARLRLETELSQPVPYVSYPYGANSGMTRRLAQWAGYRMGFTTESRLVVPGQDNAFALPRCSWAECAA